MNRYVINRLPNGKYEAFHTWDPLCSEEGDTPGEALLNFFLNQPKAAKGTVCLSPKCRFKEGVIVIVVAQLARSGEDAYQGCVRDGTGEGSNMLPGIPVISAPTLENLIEQAREWLKLSVIEAHGDVRIEVREDPALTGM